MKRFAARIIPALAAAFIATVASAQVILTRGTNFSIDVASDGRIAFDLLGRIRIIPAGGGVAREVPGTPNAARKPRWSPDGTAIVFQARDGGQEQVWLYEDGATGATRLGTGGFFDHQPSWHPDGTRIVFSSDRRDTGFDIWEMDVQTGLAWRLTRMPGDETEPAWSAGGDNLVFVNEFEGRWSLVLRRRGAADQVLETSEYRLSSPSWRPDGSLVTFLRHLPDGIVTEMAILSDPVLVRSLIAAEDFFVAPIAWRDRQTMLYAANGEIRQRNFNSWTSRHVPFRATVFPERQEQRPAVEARELPVMNAPDRKWVLRTARLFDGIGGGYRAALDIVIDGARIEAVEPRRDRSGLIVIDMGDLTALPGYVDGQARLPEGAGAALGPLLLTFGVTTIIADYADAASLDATWSGPDLPGPRILSGAWQLDLDTVPDINLGTDTLPTSPAGIRYEDARLVPSRDPDAVLSGLADARTPGLPELLQSRQARLLGQDLASVRRFSEAPKLSPQAGPIVLGSAPNGLGPGVGLHAEFRALEAAGLDREHVLRTAGINAAAALGLGLQLGRIAPGASADLVIVDGDPLNDIRDTLKVVGVVRNGRFFSTIGLIEKAQVTPSVE